MQETHQPNPTPLHTAQAASSQAQLLDLPPVSSAPIFSAPIYDLRRKVGCGSGYYADVAHFSQKVLREIDTRAGAAIHCYSRFLQTEANESPRSLGEYSIKLLTLGMVFSRYAHAAQTAPQWVVALARALYRLRGRSTRLKRCVDPLRAWLTRALLMPRILSPTASKDISSAATSPRLPELSQLIEWLHATGEFEQETARLRHWQCFFDTLAAEEVVHWIKTSLDLFDWFRRESETVLGAYTRGVRDFLDDEYRTRGCREDQIFCGKEPSEYHLCMVAAEVMNRGLRVGFERARNKVVLVPACMRGPYADFCRGRVSGVDMQCAACSPDCAIHRLTRRMSALDVKVYVVPHSTGYSRWLERWQREPDTGVVAVACLLNILPGGYEMRARGINAQCIPLDFPGCQKHWRQEEIATSFNQDQLLRILPQNHP